MEEGEKGQSGVSWRAVGRGVRESFLLAPGGLREVLLPRVSWRAEWESARELCSQENQRLKSSSAVSSSPEPQFPGL